MYLAVTQIKLLPFPLLFVSETIAHLKINEECLALGFFLFVRLFWGFLLFVLFVFFCWYFFLLTVWVIS